MKQEYRPGDPSCTGFIGQWDSPAETSAAISECSRFICESFKKAQNYPNNIFPAFELILSGTLSSIISHTYLANLF